MTLWRSILLIVAAGVGCAAGRTERRSQPKIATISSPSGSTSAAPCASTSSATDEPPLRPPEPVLEIAAGRDFTCALFVSGKVRCWGGNDFGQLGVRPRPLGEILEVGGTKCGRCVLAPSLVGGLEDAQHITAGGLSACAIRADRTAQCWGLLSDAPSDHAFVPTTVAGLKDVVDVTLAQPSHAACARLVGGSVKCWGGNGYGILGDGTMKDRREPVEIPLFKGAEEIGMGSLHTCARFADGTVICRGEKSFLGGNATTNAAGVSTAKVPLAGVTKLAVGWGSSCAIAAGKVHCWGANDRGELGDGTTLHRATPVPVHLPTDAASIYVSGSSWAKLLGGEVLGWGANGAGQLGDGTRIDRLTPTPLTKQNVTAPVISIAAGQAHACALLTDGDVVCWGSNAAGQLGAETSNNYRAFPRSVEW